MLAEQSDAALKTRADPYDDDAPQDLPVQQSQPVPLPPLTPLVPLPGSSAVGAYVAAALWSPAAAAAAAAAAAFDASWADTIAAA